MARGSLRRYDVQAKVSLYVSCASAVFTLGLFALLFLKGNYNSDLGRIVYGRETLFGPIAFVITTIALLLGATGAAMGVNSAGQRRNEFSRRSWIAFFIGAGTISLTIILFAAFWLLGMKIH